MVFFLIIFPHVEKSINLTNNICPPCPVLAGSSYVRLVDLTYDYNLTARAIALALGVARVTLVVSRPQILNACY